MDSVLALLPDGLPLLPITKTIGITTSAILAGTAVSSSLLPRTLLASSTKPESLSESIHSLSKTHAAHATQVPHANPQTIAIQWRRSQRVGLFATIPICTVASSCWAFLGLSTPSDATALRVLYTVAAVVLPVGVSSAIFAQQRISAHLHALASGEEDEDVEQEQKYGNEYDEEKRVRGARIEGLLVRWSRLELCKALVLGFGAALGTWASLNEAFLGGIQVGASYIIQQLVEQQNARSAVESAASAAT